MNQVLTKQLEASKLGVSGKILQFVSEQARKQNHLHTCNTANDNDVALSFLSALIWIHRTVAERDSLIARDFKSAVKGEKLTSRLTLSL